MKTFELTEEQIDMLAKCILAQIHSWSKIGEAVYPNRELTEITRCESVKLQTLLNYINS